MSFANKAKVKSWRLLGIKPRTLCSFHTCQCHCALSLNSMCIIRLASQAATLLMCHACLPCCSGSSTLLHSDSFIWSCGLLTYNLINLNKGLTIIGLTPNYECLPCRCMTVVATQPAIEDCQLHYEGWYKVKLFCRTDVHEALATADPHIVITRSTSVSEVISIAILILKQSGPEV